MAQIQPLRALRYDLERVPSLASVIAPPYDVGDPAQRATLLERTPLNIVAVDLPDAPRDELEHRYRHAAYLLERWQAQGVLVRDEEPALWTLEQHFPTPNGALATRRGVFARVRVTDYGAGLIRPHERTHPAPVQDRLALTRATRTNVSPIFSLYDDAGGAIMSLLAPSFADMPPLAGAVDDAGTDHRLRRIGDPSLIAAIQEAFAGHELLIADGHHRYEASRLYAQEAGGDGGHRYVLMLLVARQDDGLLIQPTHRLVRGLAQDPARSEALATTLREHFDLRPVDRADLRPPAGDGPLVLGYIDSHVRQALRCTLKTQAIADAALTGLPEAYRTLDTAVLEALILKGPLQLSAAAIDHLQGLAYARSEEEALALVLDQTYDCAFFLRPSPVGQVQAVAAAGLRMPAKSTSFSPKVPTGLLLSPLDGTVPTTRSHRSRTS